MARRKGQACVPGGGNDVGERSQEAKLSKGYFKYYLRMVEGNQARVVRFEDWGR